MKVQIRRGNLSALRSPLLCVPMLEGETAQKGALRELDRAIGEVIQAVLRSGDFKGALGTTVTLYNTRSKGPKRVMLVGAGSREDLDRERIRKVAARAVHGAQFLKASQMALLWPTQTEYDDETVAQALTEGCRLGAYSYGSYRKEDDRRAEITSVTLVSPDNLDRAAADEGAEAGLIVSEAACFARDLVNAPPNELTPTEMAERARASARDWGYKCRILERRDMERLGMAGLINVSKGSTQPPKFIIMEHLGGGAKAPNHVFIGKGLTFDSGGLCLKPAPKMDEMKGDMGGGAAVLGALQAVARLELPVNVIGLVPATENMTGGDAYRPGDILTMMNGKTVMIDNTDAEGRLVLADALCYAERYKPKAIIDLATLTGAVLIALGQVATAVIGTDPRLVDRLKAAGNRSFERVWELPLWPEFEELLNIPIADMKNTGGRHAGTITAAAFLKRFVNGAPWAHLDIAGTSYLDKPDGYRPQGGSGVGVRLLVEYLRGEIEDLDDDAS